MKRPSQALRGTERVVSYLTEELVELGHDVTLFASGDSKNQSAACSLLPKALRLNPGLYRPARAPLCNASRKFCARAGRIRHHPFPHRLSPFSYLARNWNPTTHNPARTCWTLTDLPPLYHKFTPNAGGFPFAERNANHCLCELGRQHLSRLRAGSPVVGDGAENTWPFLAAFTGEARRSSH